MSNNKLYKENFKKANLDINEFLTQCRVLGYYNISDINTAIIESNGKISVLPNENARPVTLRDMNINSSQSLVQYNVIVDGYIAESNLSALGFDKEWLDKQLKACKLKLSGILYVIGTPIGMVRDLMAVPEKANFAISVTLDGIMISVSP